MENTATFAYAKYEANVKMRWTKTTKLKVMVRLWYIDVKENSVK